MYVQVIYRSDSKINTIFAIIKNRDAKIMKKMKLFFRICTNGSNNRHNRPSNLCLFPVAWWHSADGILEIAMATKVRSVFPLENKGRKEEKVKWPISACKCVACEREREHAYAIVWLCEHAWIYSSKIHLQRVCYLLYMYTHIIWSSIVGSKIFCSCSWVNLCMCACVLKCLYSFIECNNDNIIKGLS